MDELRRPEWNLALAGAIRIAKLPEENSLLKVFGEFWGPRNVIVSVGRQEAAEVCSLHLVQLKGVTNAPSLFVEDEYL